MSLSSLVAEVIQLIVTAIQIAGLPGLFALMAVESFGIPPLPSEVILPVAGWGIAAGWAYFSWPTVMVAAVGGGLVGALCAYHVGAWAGLPFVRRIGAKFGMEEKDLQRAENFFERRGPITVFSSRMVPIIRAFISYPAGAAKMDRAQFSLYTVAGSTPFTAVLVYAGFVLQKNWAQVGQYFRFFEYAAIVGVVLVLLYLFIQIRARRHPDAASASPSSEPEANETADRPPT